MVLEIQLKKITLPKKDTDAIIHMVASWRIIRLRYIVGIFHSSGVSSISEITPSSIGN